MSDKQNIHTENCEKYLNNIIDALPPYMEKEKMLLCIARDSIVNHLVWSYSNKPYSLHNQDLWNEIIGVLDKYKCKLDNK